MRLAGLLFGEVTNVTDWRQRGSITRSIPFTTKVDSSSLFPYSQVNVFPMSVNFALFKRNGSVQTSVLTLFGTEQTQATQFQNAEGSQQHSRGLGVSQERQTNS